MAGFGANVQSMVSAEAASLAAVIVIIFGITCWLKKETGKLIGSIVVLGICLLFIIEPDGVVTLIVKTMKQIFGMGGTAAQIVYHSYLFVRMAWGGMAA